MNPYEIIPMGDGILPQIVPATSKPMSMNDFEDIMLCIHFKTNEKLNQKPMSNNQTNIPPSQEAIEMKRKQDNAKCDNIIALLDKKKQHQNALRQIEGDLDHVGYNRPITPKEPERLTEFEWDKKVESSGSMLVNRKFYEELYKDKYELDKINDDLYNQIRSLKFRLKKKSAKKLTAKKRK